MPYLQEGTQLMENSGGMLNELSVVYFDIYILGLCLGWKGQLICCVTRGEGGSGGWRGRRER